MNKEKSNNRKGFTLAEVLIALGIIGIVAAMTIPSLMQNINNKQLITATNNFNRRFGEALKIMNSQGVLAGRKTTQGFLDELSKVFKVAKVCDNTKLDQCFSKNITWGNGEVVDTSKIKVAKDLVDDKTDWKTDVMGVQFANGVSALLAYNPNCQQDQGNTNLIQVGGDKGSIGFSTNNCLAMLYDVSSNKKPNKMGQDISITSNVKNLSGIIAIINGVKITKIAQPNTYDPINCQDTTSDDYKYCYNTKTYDTDYWASAAKICGSKENMADFNDLLAIAKYWYNSDDIDGSRMWDNPVFINQDEKRTTELLGYGFPASKDFYAWSSDKNFGRRFRFDRTYKSYATDHDNTEFVICVKH